MQERESSDANTPAQTHADCSSSRKSQSVKLEHNTVEPVAVSCTYASAINTSKISSVFIVYRRKTLTGSPDPMHANGTDKPCICIENLEVYHDIIENLEVFNDMYLDLDLCNEGFNARY